MLKWEYDKQNSNFTLKQVFDIAKKLRENKEISKIEYDDFKINYPKLFQMCTDKSTTDDNFKAIEKLVFLREEVNCGKVSEMEAEYKALHIASSQKIKS